VLDCRKDYFSSPGVHPWETETQLNLGNLLQEVSLVLALAGHLIEDEEKAHEWAERMFLAFRFPGVSAWAREKILAGHTEP